MNNNSAELHALLDVIPPGKLRLVDNRIFLGETTWAMAQPITVGVLHPKHTKDDNRVMIRGLLDIINLLRGHGIVVGEVEVLVTGEAV